MFLFVNSLAFPIIEKRFSPDLVSFSSNIEFVLGGLSGAVLGFFADSKGRKRLAVAGFALLGLGYAILGFTNGDPLGWWVYTFIDGIAWGTFVMLFVFTLWGDLAEGRNSEKIYAIGIMPYLLSTFIRYSMGSLLSPYFQSNDITPIFSFLSFFLFVGVLPLVFAPETLAEHTIKNNDLKSYISKAQKQVSKKEKQTKFKENDYAKEESQDKSEEYKKAQELAEKYY
jgi:MFS family permease